MRHIRNRETRLKKIACLGFLTLLMATLVAIGQVEPEQTQTEHPKQNITFVETTTYLRNTFPSFTANVTAYCASACCTAPYDDGITASGAPVEAHRTIAMGKQFPFGTLVMIEGFDGIVFEVQDRGAAIVGNAVDIYMRRHHDTIEFGRQQLSVWVLRYGDE